VIQRLYGEVREWFNRQSWKDCVRETVPRVRIPSSPPSPRRSVLTRRRVSPSFFTLVCNIAFCVRGYGETQSASSFVRRRDPVRLNKEFFRKIIIKKTLLRQKSLDKGNPISKVLLHFRTMCGCSKMAEQRLLLPQGEVIEPHLFWLHKAQQTCTSSR
jgi:hypothetical protein